MPKLIRYVRQSIKISRNGLIHDFSAAVGRPMLADWTCDKNAPLERGTFFGQIYSSDHVLVQVSRQKNNKIVDNQHSCKLILKERESMSVFLDLERNGIVAVLRHARIQTIVPIAQTLKEAGVTVLEVTMETPMALRIIEKLCIEFADHMTIGAGTVLDAETARAAILAGAQFVVSPTVNIETIRTVKRYGVLCMPGAMTPSEILTAYEFGADIVKVFPANVLGPAYIKAIAGPFPHIPLLATGGINLENVEDYIKAGVVAVGLGNSLLDPSKEMTNEELIRLKETARRFVEKVRNAKQWLIDRKLG